MATSQPKPMSPPNYPQPPENDGVHNHFYQIQADDQRPIAWYRRKRCFYIAIALAVVTLIAISAGVASIIVLSRRKPSHQSDEQEASVATSASTISSVSSVTSSSSSTTSPMETPSTMIISSIVTVTLTKSAETKAIETTVLTLTATQTEPEEDIGDILSSMLSPFPIFTTEVVTVSVTADKPTASSTSSSETSTEASSTSITPSPTRTPSSSSSPSPSPSVLSPSLSNISHIAAVDVNIGPSSLHRRLIVWQDDDANIIVRDSANGRSKVYRIKDELVDDGIKPKLGTHLAAAPDDSGAIHVFYIGSAEDEDQDETSSVAHLVQRKAGEWESKGVPVGVTEDSSLSATWHQSGNGTHTILLGFQSPDKEICLLLVGDAGKDPKSDDEIIDVTKLLNLDTDGWSAIGLSIASGVPLGSDGNRTKTGRADLYVLMEGSEQALVAECSIENDSSEDSRDTTRRCQWLTTVFTNADGEPIEISSHPTQLAWTLLRPSTGAPPTIHGFLTLGAEGSTIDDHRLVAGKDDSEQTGASTTASVIEPQSTMISYKVEEADIEAMAMTDERTLLVRAGARLFEFSFVDGGWQDRREIETILSADKD